MASHQQVVALFIAKNDIKILIFCEYWEEEGNAGVKQKL